MGPFSKVNNSITHKITIKLFFLFFSFFMQEHKKVIVQLSLLFRFCSFDDIMKVQYKHPFTILGFRYLSDTALQYLIYLMFSQDNRLWRDTRDPWNGWRIISVVGKKEKKKVRFKIFLCISSQVFILVFNVCVSMVQPLRSIHLLA